MTAAPHRKTCPACDGDGSLMVDNYDVSSGQHLETCNTCGGRGDIEIEEESLLGTGE